MFSLTNEFYLRLREPTWSRRMVLFFLVCTNQKLFRRPDGRIRYLLVDTWAVLNWNRWVFGFHRIILWGKFCQLATTENQKSGFVSFVIYGIIIFVLKKTFISIELINWEGTKFISNFFTYPGFATFYVKLQRDSKVLLIVQFK